MDKQETDFHSGDRVALKSGSPHMTVLDVGRDTGQVWCRWMSEAGTVMEGVFPAPAICPVRISGRS
jgi:uncharacterized protein YodC (DUF2158 family)